MALASGLPEDHTAHGPIQKTSSARANIPSEEKEDKTTGPRLGERLLLPASNQLPGAGRLSYCISFWRQVTSNAFVLSVIEFGYQLQFVSPPPLLSLPSGSFSASRTLAVSKEVSVLSSKTAIAQTIPSSDQFVSPIFDVPCRQKEMQHNSLPAPGS